MEIGIAGQQPDGGMEILDGVVRLPLELHVGQAEVVVRLGVRRAELQGLLIGADGSLDLAQLVEHLAHVEVPVGVAGLQREHPLKRLQRLLQLALPQLVEARVEAGIGVVRLLLDDGDPVLRILQALQLPLDAALAHAVVLVLDDLEGDLKLGDRLVLQVLAFVGQAEVVVGPHEVGDQGADLLPFLDGLVHVAEARINGAEIEVGLEVLRVQLNDLDEFLDGLIKRF